MAVKVKVINRGKLKKIVEDTRNNYLKAAQKVLERSLISEMKQGRSPVEGGRWDKPYSKSYQDVIRGKATFRKINGKVVKFDQPDLNIIGLGKRTGPVNLKLSGQLHASLKFVRKKISLLMEFTDFVAKFHDILGVPSKAGKRFRRMLPRKKGEQFNKKIDKRLSKVLVNATRAAIKKNT